MDGPSAGNPQVEALCEALEAISGKWHPRIVATLQVEGPLRFGELRDTLAGVSGKVLTECLEDLRETGLVERTVVDEPARRIEYDLTDAGADLDTVFDAMTNWRRRHDDVDVEYVLVADPDERITDLYARRLASRHLVGRAHDAGELLARLDEHVDVLVFDARLTGMDPRRVVEVVSTVNDRCRTIQLTDARPTLDVVDIGCDEILRKPTTATQLFETVDEQIARIGEPATLRERRALQGIRGLLEETHGIEPLRGDERYDALCDRIATLTRE